MERARPAGRVLSHYYTDDFEMSSPRIRDIAGEPSGVLRGKPAIGAYWRKALDATPTLHFDLLAVLIGARSVALHYRNHASRLVVETLELDDARAIVRAAAYYA